MRRLLFVAAVALGVWAVLRWRRGRSAPAEPFAPESSPADDLAARIAESRAAEAAAPAEPPEDQPADGDSAVEGKRRDVHERARQSIDELA